MHNFSHTREFSLPFLASLLQGRPSLLEIFLTPFLAPYTFVKIVIIIFSKFFHHCKIKGWNFNTLKWSNYLMKNLPMPMKLQKIQNWTNKISPPKEIFKSMPNPITIKLMWLSFEIKYYKLFLFYTFIIKTCLLLFKLLL